MAKYLNSAGVTYLWKKIKALLAKPFTVSAGDSEGNYTKVGGGSVATGNSDGDQTIIDNNGVTVSGGALTIYEDTSKGGASAVIDYDEATRLKGLKNYTLPAANGETLGGVKSGGDVTIASGVITLRPSPTFTGTPKAPTAASGTNTQQIATTAFVQAAVESKIAVADAMRYKGTLGTGGTITALPASHKVGDSYKVITAGTYAGQKCEVGDMVICVTAGSTANDAHWTVVQSNVDGAVTGPTSAVSGCVAVFNGTTGKVIKDGGISIDDIPTYSEVVSEIQSVDLASGSRSVVNGFDTPDIQLALTYLDGEEQSHIIRSSLFMTFTGATTTVGGMMTSSDKVKLNGIATGATADSALSDSEIDAAIAAAG